MDTRGAQRVAPPGFLPILRRAIGDHRFRFAVLAVKRYAVARDSKPIAAVGRTVLRVPVTVPLATPRLRTFDPAAVLIVGVFVERLQGVDNVIERDSIIRSGHLPQSGHGFDGTESEDTDPDPLRPCGC